MKKSVIFFGIMRGGSSITFDSICRLLKVAGYQYRDFIGEYYDKGISLDYIPDEYRIFNLEGFLYGPFRELPAWPAIDFKKQNLSKILVIRDPRDCLVSHYYAMQGVHSRVSEKFSNYGTIAREDFYQNIDIHCIVWARYFRLRMESYINLCKQDSSVKVYKYEDIIYNFRGWIFDVLEFLGLEITEPLEEEAALLSSATTFINPSNDKTLHNRNGLPNQYLSELSAEAIEEMSQYFAECLEFFSYTAAVSRNFLSDASSSSRMLSGLRNFDSENLQFKMLAKENGFRIQEILDLKKLVESSLKKE